MRVFLPIIWHDLTHCVARAFALAGHEVQVFDWRLLAKANRRTSIEQQLIDAALKFRPDLAFCQFQHDNVISRKFPQKLNEAGCFTVNWSGDVREPMPNWYVNLSKHFDVTAFTNMPDVEEIRAMGHRSEFLQIGYDERLYNTDGEGERSGVVFIGNNYRFGYPQSAAREEMVKRMAEVFGPEFVTYGIGWDGLVPSTTIGGYVREPGDADVLRRSSVAVGMDHFFRAGFASDRLLRATACGCAVVQWHYDSIEVEHPHVIAVRSLDEMVGAVRTLLADPIEAGRLGALNAANTLANHRWDNRVKQIESWM